MLTGGYDECEIKYSGDIYRRRRDLYQTLKETGHRLCEKREKADWSCLRNFAVNMFLNNFLQEQFSLLRKQYF